MNTGFSACSLRDPLTLAARSTAARRPTARVRSGADMWFHGRPEWTRSRARGEGGRVGTRYTLVWRPEVKGEEELARCMFVASWHVHARTLLAGLRSVVVL
eukprot:scaffold5423_cov133-Isochrysis_galbana.AAC.3